MKDRVFEDEIDLVWLLRALLRRIWIILAVAVISATAVVGYTKMNSKPTYTSTSTMFVLTKETTIASLADLEIGSQLTKDYMVLITSRKVLNQVIENLELKISYEQLKSRITVANPEDTRILKISVTMPDAKMSKTVVDELAVVSAATMKDIMDMAKAPEIIDKGEIGTKKAPNITRNAVIGFVLGALIVCLIVVVLELLNDSIQSDEDIEKYLGIPSLAEVPRKEGDTKQKRHRKAKV